jgi:hypothetical protein
MQTRIGVELSSPTCLIRYRLFYRREILLLSGCGVCIGGGRCVVGCCLDSPCGGSITGSFCSRSQYQCGAILPADVCIDAVHRSSVGRNQDCVPACCIILRYKLHYLYRGMIGTYVYGIIQWSPGCQGASCLKWSF